MFYEWAHGVGPIKRVFRENSVMGKQMLETDYVTSAINQVMENARNGVFGKQEVVRSLGKAGYLSQLSYPADFAWDATVANPARAFQGSIKGDITPGKPYTNDKGTFVPMTIRLHDENTAASGTRFPPILGGYQSGNEGASLVPQENPHGEKGPFRTLHVDYIMHKDVPLNAPPLRHSPTFHDTLNESLKAMGQST